MKNITREGLAKVGYIARQDELRAVQWALTPSRHKAARSILLMGDPGVGKSALAEATAAALGAPCLIYQCHDWTDSDEFFVGVNIQAAISGDAESVSQPGILARAAEQSQKGFVVLLLDELDKAPERTEALLLDWLQSGRVPIAPGKHLATKLANLLVFITSNAARDHTEALIRRCRRVKMKPLGKALQVRILTKKVGAPKPLVGAMWEIARLTAKADGANLSLQEGIQLFEELSTAHEVTDIMVALQGWAVRGDGGEKYLKKQARSVGSLWAPLKEWIREQ